MRYSKLLAFSVAAVGLVLSTASAKAEDGYWYGSDVRHDRRDLRHDYAQAEGLREDMAADRLRRNEDLRCGRFGAAEREERDIRHDERALRDQRRDIRHDRRDLYWDER